MSIKTVVTLVLLVFVVVAVSTVVLQSRETTAGVDMPTARAKEASSNNPADGVVAIYFHGISGATDPATTHSVLDGEAFPVLVNAPASRGSLYVALLYCFVTNAD